MFKFLQTIKTIKKLEAVEPRKNWLKNQRIYFAKMAQAEEMPLSKFPIPLFLKSKLWVSLAAFLIIFGVGGETISYAQAALPSDTLFPVKLFTEKIQELLTIGNENKIDFALKLAEKRLEEIEQEVEKNNNESVKNENFATTGINRAKNNLEKAEALIKKSSDSNKDENKNLKHIEKVLEKLEKVSERKNRIAKKKPDLVTAFNALDLASIKIEEEANKKINETASTTDMTNILENQARKAVNRAENKIRIVGEKLGNFTGKIVNVPTNSRLDNNKKDGESENNHKKNLKKLEQLTDKLENSAKKFESAAENLNDAKQQLKNRNFNEAIHKANEGFKNSVEIEE